MRKQLFIYVLLLPLLSNAQCNFNTISGLKMSGDCGDRFIQGVVTNQGSLYGNCGGYQFTPPLTDDDVISEVGDIVSYKDFQLYPNPTRGNLFIKLPPLLDVDKISIFNILGEHVNSYNVEKENRLIEMNLDTYQSGFYIVKVISHHKIISSTSFFKL